MTSGTFVPLITQYGIASPSPVPPDPRLLIEYNGAADEMLGLHGVPDVSCAILVVGMGPNVVAHMHPGASGIVVVQPLIALRLILINFLKIVVEGCHG